MVDFERAGKSIHNVDYIAHESNFDLGRKMCLPPLALNLNLDDKVEEL